jgi:hypothetical protein
MESLKHYHVKWSDGRETDVKLNEADVKSYREAGAEVTELSDADVAAGPSGKTTGEKDAERLAAEQRAGQSSTDSTEGKASAPTSNKAQTPPNKADQSGAGTGESK